MIVYCYELDNSERVCFGLSPVQKAWRRVEIECSPYSDCSASVYLDGTCVKKLVVSGANEYRECDLCEPYFNQGSLYLSAKDGDGRFPRLTYENIRFSCPVGITLSYSKKYICLYSMKSRRNYYMSCYDAVSLESFGDFRSWVSNWCADTSADDISKIEEFASLPGNTQLLKEGDFFRFRCNRRTYGYGRILADYTDTPEVDILKGRTFAVCVYAVTDSKGSKTPEELVDAPALPSYPVLADGFENGDYDMIGNLPIDEHTVDYPPVCAFLGDRSVLLMGHRIVTIENKDDLGIGCCNAVSGVLNADLKLISSCIASKSILPYWEQDRFFVKNDLRAPFNGAYLEKFKLKYNSIYL